MDINSLREQIDKTDSEIIRLFERRMAISKDIALYKMENELPLHDEQRERQLFENRAIQLENGHLRPYLKQLFKTLTRLSKGYQLQSLTAQNVVLIGMMGSGKSMVGQMLANRLGMEFVDVDKAIETQQGMTIPQLFEKFGAQGFRQIETKKIAQISKEKRHIISTGGGAVLCEKNMSALKQNAVIIFLNRDIDEIVRTIDTKNRPLLKDGAEILYKIYSERLALYKRWCDMEISGAGLLPDKVSEDIIQKLFARQIEGQN